MKEEIIKLINLQEIDTEIAGFNSAIARKQKTITDREQSILEKEEAIAGCQRKDEALQQLQRDTALENEDAAARIKDRQNKMMQVQTSREHQALLKEIEENKKLLKETEEKTLQIMEQLEQLAAETAELENLCKGEKELLKEEMAQVEKEIKKIDSTRKKVTTKHGVLAEELSQAHMKRYNMLLKKRDNLAVVPVIESVCQGCFMTIPPQQFNEVRKGNKLNLCPNCQRMLYFKEKQAPEEVEAVEK
ncbi:zinc ribbon domain-containing protein [Desulfogranum mediterraneum]|uniref:zinc ribbon domain-containing protein n=1 Tax=Desulfogranum mediterraneum TaxID=160661 RepID=UPI0004015A99|nr:C4-type zinc ribbon domain-containing protein [Desulfogranum mediterraneum]